VLQGNGPVDKASVYPPYDHPFFGQIFLAGVFGVLGFPDLLTHQIAAGDVHSIEMLYLVPRVLMGILSVVDTFLVYKICERRYNKNRSIAFIASVLFAVMPMTWLLKMVMLESIQLPFILLATLSAIYIKKDPKNNYKDKNIVLTLISGIFVGLAILTKMSAITIIPVGIFLVYTNSRSLKILGLWFIPVILIPLIWPIYAFSIGDFKYWLDGLYLQTHRDEAIYKPVPLFTSIKYLIEIDPIVVTLGSIAIVFAAIRKDLFLLLWSIPMLIFFYFVHSQFFLVTPVLPAFCIASAKMIDGLSNIIRGKKIRYVISLSTLSVIGAIGLISITYLIITNLNSAYFQAVAFVIKFLSYSYNDNAANSNNNIQNDNGKNKVAVVSEDRYYWIPQKILQEDQYYKVWDGIRFSNYEKAENLLLVIDDPVKYWLTSHSQDRSNENVRKLETIYDSTFPVVTFEKNKYPSRIGDWNPEKIEIRTNRTDDLLLNSSAFVVNIDNGNITKERSKVGIVIPVIQIDSPLYWNDSLRNCDIDFKCTSNFTTGWKDNGKNSTSFQISTNTTSTHTWSYITGREIQVNPGEHYQLVTHMKLNEFATQSHIAMEGYNITSKRWYQFVTQCPAGINGHLNWQEFSCEIIIPTSTTKIRPVLDAGWSSQPGKQAVTLFDAIYLSKISPNKTTHNNITTIKNNLVPNPDFTDFNIGRIASSCQFRGDFDVQVGYDLLDKSQSSNSVKLSLIAQHDNMTYDNPENGEQIIVGSKVDSLGPTEMYKDIRTHILNTTSHPSEKLRMIRSGSIVEGFYYRLGKWIPIYFQHVNPIDVNIILQIDTRSGLGQQQQPLKMAFDNHVINKGHIANCKIK
jgi:Dolichyl-phosphate-mannose-protein mannosyltransferase